eukprot:4898892-Amphidinium_carterae.2
MIVPMLYLLSPVNLQVTLLSALQCVLVHYQLTKQKLNQNFKCRHVVPSTLLTMWHNTNTRAGGNIFVCSFRCNGMDSESKVPPAYTFQAYIVRA